MKVETNLKSGNILTGAANMGCQSLQGMAGFVTRANQEASNLANGAVNLTQSAWNKLAGWIKSV